MVSVNCPGFWKGFVCTPSFSWSWVRVMVWLAMVSWLWIGFGGLPIVRPSCAVLVLPESIVPIDRILSLLPPIFLCLDLHLMLLRLSPWSSTLCLNSSSIHFLELLKLYMLDLHALANLLAVSCSSGLLSTPWNLHFLGTPFLRPPTWPPLCHIIGWLACLSFWNNRAKTISWYIFTPKAAFINSHPLFSLNLKWHSLYPIWRP